MSQNVLQNVIAAEDIVWHQTDLGPELLDKRRAGRHRVLHAVQCATDEVRPRWRIRTASPRLQPHAFYFLSGTGRVQLGEQFWETKPGTLVKVPADVVHSLINAGADDLVFLVVYDPPHVATD